MDVAHEIWKVTLLFEHTSYKCRVSGLAWLTFIIESIYPVDARTLVVSSEQEEILRIFDLVREEQADSLQRLLPSVYVVTQEQVVWFGGKAPIFK